MTKITTSDGKYTFEVPCDDYRVFIARYAEAQWVVLRAGSVAVVALMTDLEAARDEITKLRGALALSKARDDERQDEDVNRAQEDV